MLIIIVSLATYKLMQVIDTFLPKEPMPWVKVLAGVVLGYAGALLANLDYPLFAGLAVATLAGTVHSVLRLLTLAGDLARKRSLR
jgi:hypothetical protein